MRLLTRNRDGSLGFKIANENTTDTPYAILSHTWGRDDEEVTFQDIRNGTAGSRLAYHKIDFILRRAEEEGLAFAWIDTCCINKDSYVELGEAINLMFHWYAQSTNCYVYLGDVLRTDLQDGRELDTLRKSRWFYRGWTLQELLAPARVEFYDRNAEPLGTRTTLSASIESITNIPVRVLQGTTLHEISLPERFKWLSGRQTRKAEDMSYCLLGLLDISLPFNYGESGDHARQRLLDEVEKEHGRRTANELRILGVQTTHRPTNLISEAGKITEDKILDFLKFESMDARRENIDEPFRGSCDWLLQHRDYQRWFTGGHCFAETGLLWIKGHPGAGKSTLVRFADVSAEQQCPLGALQISFYFNARGGLLERSTAGLYRSLLLQLFHCAPDLLTYACKQLVTSATLSKAGVLDLTMKQLQKLLKNCVRKLQPRFLRCFVDALDECDIIEVKEMMEVFQDLTEVTPGQTRFVTVCFASRYYPSLHVKHCHEIRLDSVLQHSGGLRNFVYSRLDLKDTVYGRTIKQQVVAKAKGVYMWAVLVVRLLNNELANGSAENIVNVIERLPPDLDNLYRKIARDNEQGDIDRFRLCVQFILFARRPLSVHELYHAITFALRRTSPVQIDRHYHLSKSEDLLSRYISNISRGFAELKPDKAATVQFIHESVRDFLLKHGGLSNIMPSSITSPTAWSHDCIKRTLADYLTALQTSRQVTSHRTEGGPMDPAFSIPSLQIANVAAQQQEYFIHGIQQAIEESYELASYAVYSLIYHAEQSAVDIAQNDFLKSFDWSFFGFICHAFGEDFEPDTRIMRLFAERCATRLMMTAFFLRDKVDFWRFHAEQPLFDAIRSDQPEMVQEVLTWPLDPNEVDRNGLTPLHSLVLNASNGQIECATIILPLLVDHGADPMLRDKEGMTVLMRACICKEIDSWLLFDLFECALNRSLREWTNAMIIALRNGHADVISELFQEEIFVHDLESRVDFAEAGSIVVMVCEAGHEDVIMSLLESSLVKYAIEKPEPVLMAVIRSCNVDFSCCPSSGHECAHTRVVTYLLDVISLDDDFREDFKFENILASAFQRGDECGRRIIPIFDGFAQ